MHGFSGDFKINLNSHIYFIMVQISKILKKFKFKNFQKIWTTQVYYVPMKPHIKFKVIGWIVAENKMINEIVNEDDDDEDGRVSYQ